MTSDVEQFRYVTERYRALQGLRRLPWLVPLAVFATLQIVPVRNPAWSLLFVAAMVGAALASRRIGGWYHRTYGVVGPNQAEVDRIALRWGIGVLVGMVLFVVLPPLVAGHGPVDGFHVLLALVAPALVTIVVAVHGWRLRHVRPDRMWLAAWLAVLAVVVLAVGSLVEPPPPEHGIGWPLLHLTGVLALLRLGDHHFLDRTLSASRAAVLL